jgi:NAD(P)-dependent dehydrogenase (short-subunit alcohol dehydrogenase family)
MELSGKVSVVTGAGRGLGQRVAVRLAKMGSAVAILSRSRDQLDETAGLIRAAGGRVAVIPADVSQEGAVADARRMIETELGRASILVNAAGVFGPIDLTWKTSPREWIETLMVNTVASYLTCHAFVPGMIAQGWGRVINVTSAAALHEPGPINGAYGTSKAALNQFTRHLAAELEGTGVTANVIHPGDVKTDMWADIKAGAAKVGPAAERYIRWAERVEQSGGDDPEKAADLIADMVGGDFDGVNGRFLWIKDGLQAPIPSW